MSNMSTNCTIEKLRECFARYVIIILYIIFSDNGRQFVSEEFENFYKNNDISKKNFCSVSSTTGWRKTQ